MPYITREDGERFIIPSYRDTLIAKKPNLLKKEILLLSNNYGEYITLQKKSANTYEVAFSPDPGYLLGECVWNYFKRPYDMIYCEAIPNTTEAILVIVKSGSVYLDGSFPIDSIPEELVIFKTQQNNFSIYIHGNVPISETPETGKFSFDASSVKSFEILPEPIFPTLPGVKAFQLQLVETVLREHGIGVFPVKQVAIAAIALVLIYAAYYLITTHKKEIPIAFVPVEVNPYQTYLAELNSPDPSKETQTILRALKNLYTMPGWAPESIEYTSGAPAIMTALVRSKGAPTSLLFEWAKRYNAMIDISQDGLYVSFFLATVRRPSPTTISPMNDIVGNVLDRVNYVAPGNNVQLSAIIDKKAYIQRTLTINFSDISPLTLEVMGQVLEGVPIVMNKLKVRINNGNMSGSVTFTALGK